MSAGDDRRYKRKEEIRQRMGIGTRTDPWVTPHIRLYLSLTALQDVQTDSCLMLVLLVFFHLKSKLTLLFA